MIRSAAMRDELEKIALDPATAGYRTLAALMKRGTPAHVAIQASGDVAKTLKRGDPASKIVRQYSKRYPKTKTAAMADELEKIAIVPLLMAAGGMALRALPRFAPGLARGASRVSGGLFRKGLMGSKGVAKTKELGKGLRGVAAKRRKGLRASGTGLEYGSVFTGGGGNSKGMEPKTAAAGKGALIGAALGAGKGAYDIPKKKKKAKEHAGDIALKAGGGAVTGAALAEAARAAEAAGKRVVKGTQETVKGQIRAEGKRLQKAMRGSKVKLRWPFTLAHKLILKK